MRVAFRVDAGPLIGGGHAMRCLTLANALAARGAEIAFVTATLPDELARRIAQSGHEVIRVPPLPQRSGPRWHEPPLDTKDQAADAAETRTAAGSVDWLIVDHYLLDARWHSAARSFARNILVIDDLANRPYDCDLLLDQTFGRNAADYAGLVPAAARVLAGSGFALLRKEFEQERQAALDRRKNEHGIHRILISVGTTDIGGSTAKIVDELLSAAPQSRLDVVLGRNSTSLELVAQAAERNARVRVHVDANEMAALMRDADLAVGAGGTTSWERCCLGLPTIALVLAENQRPSAEALAEVGAALVVDRVEEIGPTVRRLSVEPVRLAQMSAAAFPIVDGRGAERVASAVLGDDAARPGTLRLRSATRCDMQSLWLWRNDPVTRKQSRNTDPISWTSHVRWVNGALTDATRRILIAERDGKAVGSVGFHQVNGETEVSIVVAPSERGSGVGRTMLNLGVLEVAGDLRAAVRCENEASRRLFESCGFEAVESQEPGYLYLRRGEHRQRKHA